MGSIPTHENERVGVRGSSCETAHVANGVAGCVEEVEGSIFKVVVCVESPDLQTTTFLFDANFSHFAAFEIGV